MASIEFRIKGCFSCLAQLSVGSLSVRRFNLLKTFLVLSPHPYSVHLPCLSQLTLWAVIPVNWSLFWGEWLPFRLLMIWWNLSTCCPCLLLCGFNFSCYHPCKDRNHGCLQPSHSEHALSEHRSEDLSLQGTALHLFREGEQDEQAPFID